MPIFLILLPNKPTMKKQNKKEVLHPDDNFFKIIMREAKNARAYLVNFYPSIAALIDLDTLQLSNTSFTNAKFKTFNSDIVYRCQFKESTEAIYFSLLWEHKSEPEEHVAIQVGLYMMEALYTLVKKKDTKLEPVLPLIFYNGKEGWQPKTITELFQNHPYFDSFKAYLPNFQFLFKNITNTPPEELLAIEERFFRSSMIAMANRFNADLLIENISIIFEEDNPERLLKIATYFFAIIERSPKKFQEVVENIEFTTKSKIMSTLALIKKEGREEGLEEGIEKGQYKTSIITIRNLTLKKFDIPFIAEVSGNTITFVKQVQKDLKLEDKIKTLLKKKETPAAIAKKLKVSEWFVEVIRDLGKKKKGK